MYPGGRNHPRSGGCGSGFETCSQKSVEYYIHPSICLNLPEFGEGYEASYRMGLLRRPILSIFLGLVGVQELQNPCFRPVPLLRRLSQGYETSSCDPKSHDSLGLFYNRWLLDGQHHSAISLSRFPKHFPISFVYIHRNHIQPSVCEHGFERCNDVEHHNTRYHSY